MKTASAAQEHPHLALAVSYGPQFVSQGFVEDPQAAAPAVEGGACGPYASTNRSKEHALGLLGLFTLTASSLVFWRKKKEDA